MDIFMKMMRAIFCMFILISIHENICSPKLTVVLVIDNLSHTVLSRIQPYVSSGIALLTNNGLRYEQAYWPHAIPSTAPGHTGLVSGTLPLHHGIIGNKWIDAAGKKIASDDDTPDRAAVFSPNGLYTYGKSAHNTMVDTLADQIVLNNKHSKVFSLSLKSRAAIAMAGTLGKALWYDDQAHQFTSSKAYFKMLPSWVHQVNQSVRKTLNAPTSWNLVFEKNNPAYANVHQNIYEFAREKSLIGSLITAQNFEMTPVATTALITLAQACLAHEFYTNEYDNFILFLSISSTDKVFHRFGPNSFEYLDMLYHLDNDLKTLIDSIYQQVKPEDVLFVLTADHGGMPIVEDMQRQGYTKARRINTTTLKNQINTMVHKKFTIPNLVVHIDPPDIYLDHTLLVNGTEHEQKNILKSIKKLVLKQPGIKKVWTFKELQKKNTHYDFFEQRYKQQLFADRSGDIIFQVFPYVYAGKYAQGTGHATPYEYDTHVPLMLYQKNITPSKKIFDTVWVPQIAPTLAHILGVPSPSAATFDILPSVPRQKNL